MRDITGKDRICAVIGKPIRHTLSPNIHNGISTLRGDVTSYVPFHVEPGDLETAIKGAYALGIYGMNVTMPHKKEVMSYLTAIDESARRAMAVNTLVYTDEGYKGYNTDINGLRRALVRNKIDWKDKHVVIIGCGGAAYANCLCVIEEARKLTLINRTREKAEALKAYFEQFYETTIEVCGMEEPLSEKADVVFQTTGVGMGDLTGQMPRCTPYVIDTDTVAVDLIYSPWETAFLTYAKEKGCQIMNGFDMLFYQGVEAYEIIHDVTVEETLQEQVRETILKEIE